MNQRRYLAIRAKLEELLNPAFPSGVDNTTLLNAIIADLAGEEPTPEDLAQAKADVMAVLDQIVPESVTPEEMQPPDQPTDLQEMVTLSVSRALTEAMPDIIDVLVEETAARQSPPPPQRRLIKPAHQDLERNKKMALPKQPTPPVYVRRQPAATAPQITNMNDLRYDHLTARDMASGYVWMQHLRAANPAKWKGGDVSEDYVRAMTRKAAAEVETRTIAPIAVMNKFTRTDQVMATNISSYGTEWVGQLYSTDLWQMVRQQTNLLSLMTAKGMMEREIPQGYKSDTIPIEGNDPVFYVAPQLAANDSTTGVPLPKVGSQSPSTGNKELTVKKLMCVVTYSGEMEEDSLIPLVPELRRKIETRAAEIMENILINGDTNVALPNPPTTAYNINSYHGTPASGQVSAGDFGSYPAYTLVDGLIKLGLVTTSGQSIQGTAINEDLLLSMVKKLGPSGKFATQRDRCLLVFENNAYWSLLGSPLFKQEDKVGSSSVVTGAVTQAYGIDIYQAGEIALARNADGYIDIETAGNNTKGRIILTRPDRWAFGWKRQVETEVTRWARSDATEIVTSMRWGLTYRDGTASVVAYGLTV